MLTVKDLVTSTVSTTPDGKHWEPALPVPFYGWRVTWRDAWAVLNGRAHAIRQTTVADVAEASR
jgi:hypothetical protein